MRRTSSLCPCGNNNIFILQYWYVNFPQINASTILIYIQFGSAGFGTLFTILDPVSRVLNIAFQVYGVASCFLTIVTTVYTLNSPSCVSQVLHSNSEFITIIIVWNKTRSKAVVGRV